ncbi:NirD/YgiW/YdeI family stress tolerance protein [bacterium]|nr:NirD/YgiW/YdeI family stress tolerance protein [bacterium]
MKKIISGSILSVLMIGAASAEFVAVAQVNPNGVVSEEIISVSQLRNMRDETPVVLVGTITEQLGKDTYTFMDNTGSITVEIDGDEWGGQTITPNDTVKIYGEVERGIFTTEIDVDSVQKM